MEKNFKTWKFQLESLFDGQSKNVLVSQLYNNPEEIFEFIQLIESSKERIAWRAAWVIDHLNQRHPRVVEPYALNLLEILKKTNYNGARRSLLKILITNPTPANEDGEIVDLCFQWIRSPAYPIAIRAYAMQYIYNLLHAYPELTNEFQLTLETVINDQSKGVRGKARKILSKISCESV